MKKLFSVMLALAMLVTAAAFAEAEDFLGIWYLNLLVSEDTEYSPADLAMSMTLELNEDGTARSEYVMGGETETGEGSWAMDGDSIMVTIEDAPMAFLFEDGLLAADNDGTTMVFGREPVEIETYIPAAPVAAGEADFAGSWIAFEYGTDGVFMDAALTGMDMVAEFSDGSMLLSGFLGSDTPIPMTFADGAYTYASEDESQTFGAIRADMLEDGNLQLTLTLGDTEIILIMEPAEAEEAAA